MQIFELYLGEEEDETYRLLTCVASPQVKINTEPRGTNLAPPAVLDSMPQPLYMKNCHTFTAVFHYINANAELIWALCRVNLVSKIFYSNGNKNKAHV